MYAISHKIAILYYLKPLKTFLRIPQAFKAFQYNSNRNPIRGKQNELLRRKRFLYKRK